MVIRNYQQGDHAAIAGIFMRAIHEIGCEHYSPEQCRVWANKLGDLDQWEQRCEVKRPFVSVVGSVIAGFLELDPDGHVDCAYVIPDFKRRGVMRGLVRQAVATAFARGLTRVYVEASKGARPLFEGEGFKCLAENQVEVDGVVLVNYKMELVKVA